MTFTHKLSVRLALLKDAFVVVALATAACERPLVSPITNTDPTIRLQIIPKSVTLPTDGTSQLMAVALNSTGDTVDLSLSWTATGGRLARPLVFCSKEPSHRVAASCHDRHCCLRHRGDRLRRHRRPGWDP